MTLLDISIGNSRKKDMEITHKLAFRPTFRCGNCTYFPCYKKSDRNNPACSNFAIERECKPECNQYIPRTLIIAKDGRPVSFEGTCKISGRKIGYVDKCYILSEIGISIEKST
ncbi:MAG: hypothetical protein Q8L29_01945 [archaeon]|nr:hypothetical protein [archaeon]